MTALSERVVTENPIYRRGRRVVLVGHPAFPDGTRGKVSGHLKKYIWTDAGKEARYWGAQVTFDVPVLRADGATMIGTGNTASYDRLLAEEEWALELRTERERLLNGQTGLVTCREDYDELVAALAEVERKLALVGVSVGVETQLGRLCGRCARKIDQLEPIRYSHGRHYHEHCAVGPLAIERVASYVVVRTLAETGR